MQIGIYYQVLILALLAISPSPAILAEDPPKFEWWAGKPMFVATPRPTDGRYMGLTMDKFKQGKSLGRPLVIWAIGSSYANYQGEGHEIIAAIRERYPDAPEIVYRKHVGSGTFYNFLDGWARHLLIADPPDVVLIHTVGDAAGGPEEVIRQIRMISTADILLPTIHWRKREEEAWGKDELPPDQDVGNWPALVEKYGIEIVENRGEMTEYMKSAGLTPKDMTWDNVHQRGETRLLTNLIIARHFNVAKEGAYEPSTREQRIDADDARVIKSEFVKAKGDLLTATAKGAKLEIAFEGNRIELNGQSTIDGGTAAVFIDGKPAGQAEAFYATFIEPAGTNANGPNGDIAPHGIILEKNLIPQLWTFTRVGNDDSCDFELTGSVTGLDGTGNAKEAFVSTSGQIRLDPMDWRDPQLTKRGDKFTFKVVRAAESQISFRGGSSDPVRIRLANALPNTEHTLKLVANGDGPIFVRSFDVYKPPLLSVHPIPQ